MILKTNKVYYHKRLNVVIVFKAISTYDFVWNELDLNSGKIWFEYSGNRSVMRDSFEEMELIENLKLFKVLTVDNKYIDTLDKFLAEKK